jgi:hypothetical protein
MEHWVYSFDLGRELGFIYWPTLPPSLILVMLTACSWSKSSIIRMWHKLDGEDVGFVAGEDGGIERKWSIGPRLRYRILSKERK